VDEISADFVKGELFAGLAGWKDGRVDKISVGFVKGDRFAERAGCRSWYVGEISANFVKGDRFAALAGSNGAVKKIRANRVDGKYFAYDASAYGICVRKISEEAKATMNPCQRIKGLDAPVAIVIGDCAEEAEK